MSSARTLAGDLAGTPTPLRRDESRAVRLWRHARWMAGLQLSFLSAAWHGRNSAAARAALYRMGHELWPYTSADRLPTKSLGQLFPGIRCDVDLRVDGFARKHRFYRLYTHHACVLAALCRRLRPRRVFEFGTFEGEMTLNFWLNADPECEVFTLDLPPAGEATRFSLSAPDREMVARRKLGQRYLQAPAAAARITQLCCDSAEFDSAPYSGSFDLIYVDGAHTYEYVANDSRHAFRMLRPGGVIVWDDYNWYWAGLVRCLQEEARNRAIFHVEGSELALYHHPA